MGEECCETTKQGCCSSCEEDQMDKMDFLYELADEAWSELMKEKVKKALEKIQGEHMNKTAQVIAEARLAYWGNKMRSQGEEASWEDKIKECVSEVFYSDMLCQVVDFFFQI
jgi:hypothetical protein